MKLQRTAIVEAGDQVFVEMVIADSHDPLIVSENVSLRMKMKHYQAAPLAKVQKVALERALGVINEQIQATIDTLGRV